AGVLVEPPLDLICPPHRLYLSLAALVAVFARHGFSVTEAAEISVHGGSVRIYAREGAGAAGPTVERLLAVERDELSDHRRFVRRVEAASARGGRVLVRARVEGGTLLGYGEAS